VAGQPLTDVVSLGVLASRVPRDAVDDAVEATGKGARRRGGKLPPHVVVYLVMALALFADEDYEEVAGRLTGALRSWGSWDQRWEPPTKGAVTQARQRLGPEPLAELFAQVAEPVAGLEAGGAFLGAWRLMSVDGTELDVPDTPANREAFGAGANDGPFPKVRLVTVCECGSRAPVLAAMGPSVSKGSGEQSLARTLCPRLEEGWLLLADRLFYGWDGWCAAADSGADLLWRVKDDVTLPFLELLPDGSYRSVLVKASVKGARRAALAEAARRGEDLGPALARPVRVVEYEVTDRDGQDSLIALVTGWQAAPAAVLAPAYHERWQHETANAQVKTVLRGPGRILRPGSPDLVRQEIWGCLLTAWAISALISDAAAAAWIDPGRVSFTKAVRIVRRAVGPAFLPQQAEVLRTRAMAEMTRKRNLNPARHRSCPRVVKRWRTSRYKLKTPKDHAARHNGPPTIRLPNLKTPQPKGLISTS
jgi:transposase IS4-like protein